MKQSSNTLNQSDIVIHINEKMDSQHRFQFSNKVSKLDGVVSAVLQKKCPQLMIVAFNPLKTKAFEVINGIRKTGMQAQIVSWL